MPIAINGSGTITGISAGGLPDGVITTDDIAAAAVTQAKRSEQLTLATAQASTSGTSIDFTGIPSWVKRITVMFNGVSTSGTSNLQLRIGSTSFVTSGYNSFASTLNTSSISTSSGTAGFLITQSLLAASACGGAIVLTTLGSNIWVATGTLDRGDGTGFASAGRLGALSGTLDRVRITTVNGTDTFDAGSINIMYE
jgi:predicted anti-sigma-YlaC factor YlaD